MKQYLELMDRILTTGKRRQDRTGVGTIGLFGEQIRMNMADGFPLLTTKKVHTRSIIYELLWFLAGNTNIKFLNENGITIWDEWADKDGDLGPVYGEQWVRCTGMKYVKDEMVRYVPAEVNQIQQVVDTLRNNPYSRRNIVSAWNVTQISQMKLPPCHTLWQLYVEDVLEGTGPAGGPVDITSKRLSLHLYARSIDTFLGLPFNIASYGFLLHMLAHVTNMTPGNLIISFGDVHIYLNHIEQCKLQLSRQSKPLPKLLPFKPQICEMDEFSFEDFQVADYDPHPAIKAPVAV